MYGLLIALAHPAVELGLSGSGSIAVAHRLHCIGACGNLFLGPGIGPMSPVLASGLFFLNLNEFIYFNWRLITLQYCGGFRHAVT